MSNKLLEQTLSALDFFSLVAARFFLKDPDRTYESSFFIYEKYVDEYMIWYFSTDKYYLQLIAQRSIFLNEWNARFPIVNLNR